MSPTPPDTVPARTVTKTELFLGFLKIGMLGFGGVGPWARRIIVEERRWLSEKEFATVLGIGQVLPGPNTMNAGIMIGDRFQGLPGALVCMAGQMLVPLVLVTSLGAAYARYGHLPVVTAAVMGAASSAAGLVLGTALKMTKKVRPSIPSLAIVAAAFCAVGVFQWPMLPVLLGLVPASIAIAAFETKR